MAKKNSPHKPKTPPLAIRLPFEKVVEGLLATKPIPKKKPATKKATGKRKKVR